MHKSIKLFQRNSSYSSRLISEPFKIDNTRRMRDTSSKFPKPNFISFDAFGTIYAPKIPVYQQYYEIASKEFGFDKSLDSIKRDFPIIHDDLLVRFPNYGKNSKEISSVQDWWLELIVKLFNLQHFTKDEKSWQLCQRLIDQFSTDKGYDLYDDVIPTLEKLQQHNIPIIISSNSDARIYGVLETLGILKFIDNSDIYLSYNLDFEKPSKHFFDAVLEAHLAKTTGKLSKDEKVDYLANVWHVGDGHDKDYLGAVRSGWNGIFLDRDAHSRYLSQEIPDPEADAPACMGNVPGNEISTKPMQLIANNRVVISDLRQLIKLFGIE